METVRIKPDTSKRTRRPALSIRQRDTGRGLCEDTNIEIRTSLTEGCQQLNTAHHGSGQIVVDAGLEGLEDVDCLEDDDIDAAEVLNGLENESDGERLESGPAEQFSQPGQRSVRRFLAGGCKVLHLLAGQLLTDRPVPDVAPHGGLLPPPAGQPGRGLREEGEGGQEEDGGEAGEVREEVPGEEGSGHPGEKDPGRVLEGRDAGEGSSVPGRDGLRYEDADAGHGQAHRRAGDRPEDQHQPHHHRAGRQAGQAQAEEGSEEEDAGDEDTEPPT